VSPEATGKEERLATPDRVHATFAEHAILDQPLPMSAANQAERIVVIGGGAGGLELVVKLGKKYRRHRNVEVILVDKNPTHIWKPLLHEVATGSMNSYHDEASYRLIAKKHGFRFILGEVTDVDLANQSIGLAPVMDGAGIEMMPERLIDYSTLCVAVGSHSNDFGIPGVRKFSKQLDSREQAESFHQQFTTALHRVNSTEKSSPRLSVAIVGGGATGVELAADMHNVVQRLREYGFEHFSRDSLNVVIVEAAPMLLPRLPDRIGPSVQRELERIGVRVLVNTRVAEVTDNAVVTSEGESIPADISVWAAGVKAPAWLGAAGLPVDRLGRIEVEPDLSVRGHKDVFAIGDCCSVTDADGKEIPPRAQAAHQMASITARNIIASRKQRARKPFVYRDFGSLVSLSNYSTIGNLMGNLVRGTVFVEGWIARLFYLSLYRMHQAAIHGPFSTLLIMLGDRIYKATRASVKLH
jgi:NADH dehydrogenase